ncbi:MAG: hypothetical protein QOI91_878, partial [Solirubrobacteraceae bacterium]|nr:hypothetical protein [Solirubrobacteraceae bacterium]
MRRAGAGVAVLLVAFAAGCGNRHAPDLFVLERSGSVPGARLELRVRDDGQVSCNGAARRRLPDQLLLDAREIARELNGVAPRALAPGARSVLSYRLRLEKGTVRFSDSSRGQARAMLMVQDFTRQVARRVCGLPR